MRVLVLAPPLEYHAILLVDQPNMYAPMPITITVHITASLEDVKRRGLLAGKQRSTLILGSLVQLEELGGILAKWCGGCGEQDRPRGR